MQKNENIKIHRYKSFKLKDLLRKKIQNKQNLILCFPAIKSENAKVILNEIKIANHLLKKGFLDVVAVAYDGGRDDIIPQKLKKTNAQIIYTRDVALKDMKKGIESTKGKGANMRKFSYYAVKNLFKGHLENNLIGFLDADISPKVFGSHYVLGLFGPLILNPSKIKLVKLVYRRPQGFGRVNKVLCHPLVSVISHPIINTLCSIPYITSGEVAMKGEVLVNLKFVNGYGIEIYTLMQFILGEKFGPRNLELTNVGFFDHKHQSINDLQFMSFSILRTFFKALEEHGILTLNKGVSISNKFSARGISPPGYRVHSTCKELNEKIYRPLSEII